MSETKEHYSNDDELDEIVAKIASKNRISEKKKKDDEFENMDDSTKTAYKDLSSGLPDIYKIIGVSPSDSHEYVKKKCNIKLSKYHPDKVNKMINNFPQEQRAKEKKKLDMQYKLIREAYGILRDPEKRKFYDLQKKTVDSKNFTKQKDSFNDFIKLQDSEINEQSKQQSKSRFELEFLNMDKKHGINRNKGDDVAMGKKTADRKLEDLMMDRNQQDIEYEPTNMFEGTNIAYDQTSFNQAWDKQQRKMEKIKKKKNKKNHDDGRSLVTWDGISASNDQGIGGSDNYISVDSNYDSLYSDDISGCGFAPILDSDSDMSCSEDSDDIDASYVTNHNKDKKSVIDRFNQYEKERKLEDEIYENREFTDTNQWKSVLENPMNISSQMGSIMGNDASSKPLQLKRRKNINDDQLDAYKQLTMDTIDDAEIKSLCDSDEFSE
jgi:curved DNA-binding protein CbpA